MSSRFNTVPVIVQQIVDSMNDPNTPPNIRFNYQVQLETIRDYCITMLNKSAKPTKKR